MPNGQSSLQGRCPTCGQRVTLGAGADARDLECPRCHFRGPGSAYLREDEPLPAIEVPRDDERTLLTPREVPRDDERTHLMLSPADVQDVSRDEERTHLLLSPLEVQVEPDGPDEHEQHAPDARGQRQHERPDDARTHLLLRPEDVKEVKEGTVVSLSHLVQATTHKPSASPRPAPDDERTRLFIGQLDLSHLPPSQRARAPSRLEQLLARALGLGARIDQGMRGRWAAALIAMAGVGGVIAPTFDYLRDGRVAVLSLLASIALLTGGTAFVLAWLARSPPPSGVWRWDTLRDRLATRARLFSHDLQQLDRSPNYLKVQLAGELLVVVGLVGLACTSLTNILRVAFGSYDPPSGVRVLAGLILGAGLVLVRSAVSSAPIATPAPDDLGECVSAAAKLPAILDLSEPLPASFIGGHTPLHRALVALSQWRGRHLTDELAYRTALERHLQRELPGCRIERTPRLAAGAPAIAHLVIDDLILLHVARGFDDTRAPRALQQLQRELPQARGKPLVLVLFDAAREDLLEGPAAPALHDLHTRAPIITARMPVY